MKFSYNAVWDRTLAMLRAHAPLIVAIAGVFIFLPNLMLGHFLPPPEGSSTDPQVNMDLFTAYWSGTWYWQLLAVAASMVGTLAILVLVLDQTRPTVGLAIVSALKILPFYLLASFIVAVATALVAVVCALPFAILGAAGAQAFTSLGIIAAMIVLMYLSARVLAVLSSVAAIERRTPLDMIRRSLELTRRHGWAILGLLFLILLAGLIASLAIEFVFGGLLKLLLDPNLADFLVLLISSAVGSALAAVVILTTGSIYRELSGTESTSSLLH